MDNSAQACSYHRPGNGDSQYFHIAKSVCRRCPYACYDAAQNDQSDIDILYTLILPRTPCICQDWDKKNFIFFCTYSIKSLLIFKVQNSLLLLTFSLLPIEEASSFFTTGFLYYSFCLLHCISDKVLTLKHNLYIFVVVNEHLINYVGKYISVILFQHTILG